MNMLIVEGNVTQLSTRRDNIRPAIVGRGGTVVKKIGAPHHTSTESETFPWRARFPLMLKASSRMCI